MMQFRLIHRLIDLHVITYRYILQAAERSISHWDPWKLWRTIPSCSDCTQSQREYMVMLLANRDPVGIENCHHRHRFAEVDYDLCHQDRKSYYKYNHKYLHCYQSRFYSIHFSIQLNRWIYNRIQFLMNNVYPFDKSTNWRWSTRKIQYLNDKMQSLLPFKLG